MLRVLLITIFILVKSSILYAEVINDFKINGNERVSKETIINFSELIKVMMLVPQI